ncbi:MAG: efflux RND transporter periplasmic adaptor subunit [Planctomycetes bacterium]|nr:efflux RND transporter periplasmic adaptor subunit [Planctomycetota bacterium]
MKSRPILLVLTLVLVFGAVAFAVWKYPFDAPASPGEAAEFCVEHQLPEADCPWCLPSLLIDLGFCNGHGVPEALCVRCDPRLEAGFRAEGDWCEGHSLPESQCVLCGAVLPEPPVVEESSALPAPAATVVPDADGPRALRAPDPACGTAGELVQLRSVEDVRAAGIELGVVEQRRLSFELDRSAVLAFDGDRQVLLSSRAPGTVAEVLVDQGQVVTAGQELMVVDSAEVGEAKAALQRQRVLVELGRRDREREARLLEAGAGTERQALEAETRLAKAELASAEARQRLRSLGFTDEALDQAGEEADRVPRIALRAPFAGTILRRPGGPGAAVAVGEPVFELADLGRMWLRIDLREEDAGRVAIGWPLTLEVDALPGERWTGELDWVGAGLDPRSRTLPARAVIENPGGRLRAGMYGRARIQVGGQEPRLLVARESVQWEGCCNIVFVPEGPASFRPRPVRIGYAVGEQYVIEEGLRAGEEVVTTGAFLLKTEILKGSIGAGCCEVEAPKR